MKMRQVRIVGLLRQGGALNDPVRGKQCVEVLVELVNCRFAADALIRITILAFTQR